MWGCLFSRSVLVLGDCVSHDVAGLLQFWIHGSMSAHAAKRGRGSLRGGCTDFRGTWVAVFRASESRHRIFLRCAYDGFHAHSDRIREWLCRRHYPNIVSDFITGALDGLMTVLQTQSARAQPHHHDEFVCKQEFSERTWASGVASKYRATFRHGNRYVFKQIVQNGWQNSSSSIARWDDMIFQLLKKVWFTNR